MPVAGRAIGAGAIAGDYQPAVVVAAPEPPVYYGYVYTIDLCHACQRIGEAPAGIFDGVMRNLAAGEWRLTGAVDALNFQPGFTLDDVDGVRVVRDNELVMAGFVAPAGSGVAGLDVIDSPDGPTFTLSGPDAWSVLASRIAYPSPATGPPWAASWDVRTGQASSVAAGYILANAGASAHADRVIPGLSVVDAHAGLAGSWSGRLQPLDQLVARVCREGSITCRLKVGFDGSVVATLAAPVDRHSTVVISDAGDLTKIEHVRIPPSSTFVIAGGQGALNARTFAFAGTATGAARRETFTDQTSLSTVTEVQQSATSTLAYAGSTLTVRAELSDLAAAGLIFGYHYNLGDVVTIEIGDVRYPVPVESVTVHVGTDRAFVRPVLGDATPNLVTGIIRDVADLAARFDTQIA